MSIAHPPWSRPLDPRYNHRAMNYRRPIAGLALTLICSAALFAAPVASAQSLLDFLIAELEMERELLAEDLRLYSEARSRQAQAMTEVEEALAAIDGEIEGREVSVLSFEALENTYAEALVQRNASDALTREIRQRIYDRLRRTALLSERIVALGGALAVRVDPLSGRWELEGGPEDAEGVLTLQLNGTLVSGTYAMEDGSSGSMRGTYSGGRLRLERVDSRRGFDSIWEGEVDAARRTFRGTWTAMELSSGGPVRGTFRGEKIEPRRAVGESEDQEESP
ncbi:MAG: hypothetical protein SX243_09065 [Acidobacteriota bacterium]|nr:hypothetical protein [Acidobacteriota bacterium]